MPSTQLSLLLSYLFFPHLSLSCILSFTSNLLPVPFSPLPNPLPTPNPSKDGKTRNTTTTRKKKQTTPKNHPPPPHSPSLPLSFSPSPRPVHPPIALFTAMCTRLSSGFLSLIITVIAFAVAVKLNAPVEWIVAHWLHVVTAGVVYSFLLAIWMYVRSLSQPANELAAECTGTPV